MPNDVLESVSVDMPGHMQSERYYAFGAHSDIFGHFRDGMSVWKF